MKKWLVRVGIGIGIVALCIVAAGVIFYLRGEAQLAKKIAELKAQGLPTSFAELEAKYKLPEGTPNAADIYLKAFAAYKPFPEDKQKLLPVMGCQIDPNDNEPYPPQQMAAAAEFVELNQEMFTLLHEAGKVEDCYYPIDYSQGPDSIVELLQNIKRITQTLMIAGIYYSQTNQSQKACEAAVDQLRLGQSLSRSCHLFGHLVRIAMLGIGARDIQVIINRTSFDETQLRLLQEYLQQVSQSATISPALSGEICVCLEYRKLNRDARDTNELMFYATCLTSQDPATLIETYQQMIEIDKLPIGEQWLKFREAFDAKIFFSLLRTALPVIKNGYGIHLRIRANMNCAITALAIERYRLKEGKLPEAVDTLVPGYLSDVYIDPFDGKPLRYKQTNPGYIVYTIGEDGVDNGGRERGPNERGENQDWAFRVYR
jgi:hypothetical protein